MSALSVRNGDIVSHINEGQTLPPLVWYKLLLKVMCCKLMSSNKKEKNRNPGIFSVTHTRNQCCQILLLVRTAS